MIHINTPSPGNRLVVWARLISKDGKVSATAIFEWLELIEAACACNYWRTRDGREWVEHTGH